MRTAAILIVGVLIAGTALAHDLYIMPERFRVEPGKTIAIALHNGDAFPVSEASAPLERVRDFGVSGDAGVVSVRDLREDGKRTVGDVEVSGSGTLIATVHTIPNLIHLEAKEFDAYLREEGLQHVLDWRVAHGEAGKPGRERYSKYAKSLLISGAANGLGTTVEGLLIEIVPETDPGVLHAGAELPVRVLFHGSPAPDLQVEAAWAGHGGKDVRIAGRTDKDGRVRVRLTHPGLWRLHTIRMERCADAQAADWESDWASLTFQID